MSHESTEEDILVVDGNEVLETESTPEGEALIDNIEDTPIEVLIEEKLQTTGYAYVYEGKVLDESKLSIKSKTYIIYNSKTGLPFIFDGEVVKYGNKIEAVSAMYALMMYTGNTHLKIVEFEALKGKSML